MSNLYAVCRTCLAVAGDDFCIVAADSRLSVGYSILSRTTSKISPLTQKCVVASSGCNSDQVGAEYVTFDRFLANNCLSCSRLLCTSSWSLKWKCAYHLNALNLKFALTNWYTGMLINTARRCRLLRLAKCWLPRSTGVVSSHSTPLTWLAGWMRMERAVSLVMMPSAALRGSSIPRRERDKLWLSRSLIT